MPSPISLLGRCGVRSEIDFARIGNSARSSSEGEDIPLCQIASDFAESQSEVEILFDRDSIFLSELNGLLSDTDVGDESSPVDGDEFPDELSDSAPPSRPLTADPPASAFSTPPTNAYGTDPAWFGAGAPPEEYAPTTAWHHTPSNFWKEASARSRYDSPLRKHRPRNASVRKNSSPCHRWSSSDYHTRSSPSDSALHLLWILQNTLHATPLLLAV